MSEFQEALERIVAGPERKSRVISRRREGDHRLPRGRPRGRPADPAEVRPGRQGHDHQPRHGPRLHDGPAARRTATSSPRPSSRTRSPGLLGGNVAEQLIFGDTTTGASNDIEKATDLARRMVTEFGMSEQARPAVLREARRARLPRPRDRRAAQLQRRGRQADRRGGPRDHRQGLRAGDRGADHAPDKLVALAEKLVAEETVDAEGFEALFSDLPPKEDLHGAADHHRRPASRSRNRTRSRPDAGRRSRRSTTTSGPATARSFDVRRDRRGRRATPDRRWPARSHARRTPVSGSAARSAGSRRWRRGRGARPRRRCRRPGPRGTSRGRRRACTPAGMTISTTAGWRLTARP